MGARGLRQLDDCPQRLRHRRQLCSQTAAHLPGRYCALDCAVFMVELDQGAASSTCCACLCRSVGENRAVSVRMEGDRFQGCCSALVWRIRSLCLPRQVHDDEHVVSGQFPRWVTLEECEWFHRQSFQSGVSVDPLARSPQVRFVRLCGILIWWLWGRLAGFPRCSYCALPRLVGSVFEFRLRRGQQQLFCGVLLG